MFSGRDYNPIELLDLCKVEARFNRDATVAKILAEIAISKDSKGLIERIKTILEEISVVSIGHALERLSSISEIEDELQGGLDGIDALMYHLWSNDCTKGITALQKVLKRFEETK